MERAACKGKPRRWFFPGPGQSKRKALACCAVCSVVSDCNDYVERTGTQHGIWGGRILRRTEDALETDPTKTSVEPGILLSPTASTDPTTEST